MTYKKYYIGCYTNLLGENCIDDYLNKNVANIAAKYNISENDFDIIAKAFENACKEAYYNGCENKKFDLEELTY